MTHLAQAAHRPNRSATARAITALLTHPVSLALKGRVRDLRWRLAGRALVNPPFPTSVASVLFVCLGNICRSPFAAALAERIAIETGRGSIRFASAGIRTSQSGRSPQEACRASAAFGIELQSHEPQPLTADLIRAHDAILVMEASHLAQLRADYPDRSDRIFLLPLFDDGARGPYERFNITDPFGHGPAAFDDCYRRIARALHRWAGSCLRSGFTRRPDHS